MHSAPWINLRHGIEIKKQGEQHRREGNRHGENETGALTERSRDSRAKEGESPDKSWGKERQVPDR